MLVLKCAHGEMSSNSSWVWGGEVALSMVWVRVAQGAEGSMAQGAEVFFHYRKKC